MKLIGIILSLIFVQISTDDPIFIFDLKRKYNVEDDSESYKYITKNNLAKVKIVNVKKLRFTNAKSRSIPIEMKQFKYVEELDLSTELKGMHVRWMNGLCEFVGYHEKGKLRKLPNWLLEFKNLKKIHLEGQVKLNMFETIRLLGQIKSLEQITLEIESNEVLGLNDIKETENLKMVRLKKEDLTETEKKKIEKIFASKKFEFEIETVNRNRFK